VALLCCGPDRRATWLVPGVDATWFFPGIDHRPPRLPILPGRWPVAPLRLRWEPPRAMTKKGE